jgi:serine/threonine-protein kinase
MADWEGFDVAGRLGVGSTGTVWLARQLSVGRLVALKELAPELAGNQAVREHLRHEAQVLARLDHPNCVRVYSYLESASAAAIVMEYVEGVSLRTLTERGPLSVEQALSVLEGALNGLAGAHQQGIIHGDIKPENILLSTGGESKLVDFGLAAAVGTRRAPGTGSPTYSSPEAAAGEPLGVTSDLYSAGLVLSELLAGVRPVGVDRASAAVSLPAPVAALVSRALDPDPSARQTSARAFLDELRAAAEEGCGEDWRRRAVLVPLVVAAATGALGALGVAKAGAAAPLAQSPTASGAARRTSKLGHLLHTHPWAAAAMAGVVVVAGVGAGVAVASGNGKAPPPPAPTAVVKPATSAARSPLIKPTFAAVEQDVCLASLAAHDDQGDRCAILSMHVSTVSPEWVYVQGLGYYAGTDQTPTVQEARSDLDEAILNLRTHQMIGPTNIGFCAVPGANVSGPDLSAVPRAVVVAWGLHPCSGATPTTVTNSPTTTVPPSTQQTTAASGFTQWSGAWGAHEQQLQISAAGDGTLSYQDLTACPNCSFGSAPTSTMQFVLASVNGGTANGTVTASSDAKNYAVGQAVTVRLAAGSPGQLLELSVAGQGGGDFCNSTSAGQCGA